ncbi:DUF948 domain-containing protein [Jeotgalibacillus campisalis]|uniref:DUF948 domain-containing protein n=1 Tax=Jeotgalibacillus campisalis TaxID=220754 RepID=A0A0C2VNG6_9BACL|nr:DUF948 domain-containing protein [Jeotgalibacillus campisalis]KIL45528.1 hypothetical protein KR50_31100 [Jeotgalibacillus campisalis]
MIMKISAAGASAAFICLAAKLIQTLGVTQLTLAEVKNSINSLTKESQKLIQSAEQATVDIQSKVKLLDPLLESAKDVGEVVHSVTDKVKQAGMAKNIVTEASVNNPQSGKSFPLSSDIYTPSHEPNVNLISSTPTGGVKIKIK